MREEILAPIDENCTAADIDRAVAIARERGAHLTVVGLEGRIAVGVVPISAHDAATQRRRRRLAALGREARVHARDAGVEVDVVMVSGPPVSAVVNEARRRGADAVVVAGEASAPARWARGRAGRRLRRWSPCTVRFGTPASAA
jgi:nucleotide-binding universal stress UspA family protein